MGFSHKDISDENAAHALKYCELRSGKKPEPHPYKEGDFCMDLSFPTNQNLRLHSPVVRSTSKQVTIINHAH